MKHNPKTNVENNGHHDHTIKRNNGESLCNGVHDSLKACRTHDINPVMSLRCNLSFGHAVAGNHVAISYHRPVAVFVLDKGGHCFHPVA